MGSNAPTRVFPVFPDGIFPNIEVCDHSFPNLSGVRLVRIRESVSLSPAGPLSAPLCVQGKDTKDKKPTYLIRFPPIHVQFCQLNSFQMLVKATFFFSFGFLAITYGWKKKSIHASPASQDVVTIKSGNLLERARKTVSYYAKCSYS